MAEKKKQIEPAAPAADKKKALSTAIAQIEKEYGKGSIMRLGENSHIVVEAIPTGSLSLDIALGIGGVPKGRIIEIYGPESSGKTTLALHIVAEAQKRGGEVAYIDAEHALDPTYARALGVDIDSMLISQPDTGEQGLEICEALVRSGAIDVVVVDSVAALTPRAEIEGDMGDSHVGLLARLMSQALRKLAGSISKTNCIVIFINQLREKVGVVYGNPEVTTGGRALKFYASVRMEVRRIEAIKNGTEIIGNRTRAKIVKNKVAPPFREAEFEIMYGEGISKMGELVDLAVKLDIVQKSGSWFSMGDTRLGQGKDAVKKYFGENPEIAAQVEADVRANAYKLMSRQSQAAAKAAGRAVDVSADDFEGSSVRIEKLEPSQHKQGRWLVWLDDASVVRVGEGDVVSLGLYAGRELTDAEGEALCAAGEQSRLMERAVGLLAQRPMSRKELLDKLCVPPRQKREKYPYDKLDGGPDPALLQQQKEALRERAEGVADRLAGLGLLNDGEYARMVVRHYAAKGYGPRKIRDELYRRGVPREFWEDAMDEREPDSGQIDKLARQKLRGAEPTRENLKKVSDYLARRGYGWEEISSALDRIREESEW